MRAHASVLFLIIAVTAVPAAAQQQHAGVGPGAGISRGGGAGFVRGASVPMGHSVPVMRPVTPPVVGTEPAPVRSIPAIRSVSDIREAVGGTIHVVHPGSVTQRVTGGDTRQLPSIPVGQHQRAAEDDNHNLVTREVDGIGRASMLRNSSFASLSLHQRTRALASATFAGRLASEKHHEHDGGWSWRHRRPIIVIGWFGPLFWPYAYWDLFDYTFWPYAYDAFWPYAYDDFYAGLFGPYSYEGAVYSGAASSGRPAAVRRAGTGPEVCATRVPALTDWPIEQIGKTVEPNETQQAALNDLKDAAAKALEQLQSACPTDLPTTPTGRLAATRNRVEAMLLALGVVRPALERFYGTLGDEQKARFNLVSPRTSPAPAGKPASRLPDACNLAGAKPSDLPAARIERELQLTEAQRSAFASLKDASRKAADALKVNCPTNETLTPPGRAEAMEQRLNAVLTAIKAIQPALEDFYGALTDEQKARFNQLGAGES
jgi:hypothetical protein